MVAATNKAPLSFSAFKAAVEALAVGKRLPDAIYVHESATTSLPHVLKTLVAEIGLGLKEQWNVIKFFRRDFRVSLLSYPTFFDESYPQLQSSRTFDLVRSTSRLINYGDSENPPILHRKETLLDREHRRTSGS